MVGICSINAGLSGHLDMCNNIAAEFVDMPAAKTPQSVAVIEPQRSVTFSELQCTVNRMGNALRRQQCEVSDRVLIALPDGIELVASLYAVAKIGAIAVLVAPGTRADDYTGYLNVTRPKFAIFDTSERNNLLAAARGGVMRALPMDLDARRANGMEMDNWFDSESDALEPCELMANAPAVILYTSGSTGTSKAVAHSHQGIILKSGDIARELFGLTARDRILSLAKLHFAFGFGAGLQYPFRVGASTILSPKSLTLEIITDLIQRHRPTVIVTVPTPLKALKEAMERWLSIDLSSVRFIVSAGEPLPIGVFRYFNDEHGIEVLEGLGSTELHHFLSNRPGLARAGTCGIEAPNVAIRLIDSDRIEVAAGVVGNMEVRSRSAFLGYWGDEALTESVMVDGWIRTGDRCYRDSEGYFHYCGRQDHLAKIDGMWVDPMKIEMAIGEHAGVRNCVVLAKPAGQDCTAKLVAFLELGIDGRPTVFEIRQLLARHLPHLPSRISLVKVPQLPLLPNGKVDRAKLLASI